MIDSAYRSNHQNLRLMDSLISSVDLAGRIDSIEIRAVASPEGDRMKNHALAARRAKALKSYLVWKYPRLSGQEVKLISSEQDWHVLFPYVLHDTKVPGRKGLLRVMNDKKLSARQKEMQIKTLNGGRTYAYLHKKILPLLRAADMTLIVYVKDAPNNEPKREIKAQIALRHEDVPKPASNEALHMDTLASKVPEKQAAFVDSTIPLASESLMRPMAIKTNVLLDALTCLNIEAEVPMSKRFSLAGEWVFPWWLWSSKQRCLEVLSGSLEGRYWFKPDYSLQDKSLKDHNPLSGWFMGLYAGGGMYDLEWNKRGYQGEFFIAAGLSGGYSLPIRRNLSLEMSLGIGCLKTDYRRYNAVVGQDGAWHLVRKESGSMLWIGPTKAKISIVWYPHLTKKGRLR